MTNGKGDDQRPIEDREHFDSEYDRIFQGKDKLCCIRCGKGLPINKHGCYGLCACKTTKKGKQ